jgi:N-sulfoglucosamine sulfohydrolase
VPGHLPDTPEVRSDLADYHREVAWMDRQLGEMLAELERRGERERTLVIATSDNGRPFPGAKATCRDAGIRVPLIISGPDVRPGVCATPVSLVDLAPTIAARAGLAWDADAAGRDRAALLTDEAGRAMRTCQLASSATAWRAPTTLATRCAACAR